MKSLIFTAVGLLTGISLMAAGAYYLLKAKGDRGSVKIYGTFIAIGALMTVGMAVKLIAAGF